MQHVPKIGAFVLESLTTGMYPDPLDAVRELVQNASDSIREAERQKLLQSGTGRIQVTMDRQARRLSVKDSGTGIPRDQALASLLNVGMSSKSIEHNAGFRGIGRLAAIAYCDHITFRTSAEGEGVTTILSLDCKGIRRTVSPALRDGAIRTVSELSDVLRDNASISEDRTEKKAHGFEVILDGVGSSADVFLDIAAMERYLSQVAPVDFNHQRFHQHAVKIEEWARDHGFAIPKVILEICAPPNQSRVVYKHYKSRYKPSQGEDNFTVNDVAFYQAEGPLGASFWAWYGVNSDYPGMIDDEDCRGLRLRKHNIGLGGPERVAELFERIAKSYGRCNNYFIGEVHVVHAQAVPNARRDGFEQEGIWPQIVGALLPFLDSRRKDVYQGSQSRNQSTERIVRQLTNTASSVENRLTEGIMAEAEKAELFKRIDVARNKAKQANASGRDAQEQQQIERAVQQLEKVEQSLRDPAAFVGGRVRTHLDRKQRRVLLDVLEIVYDALNGVACAKRDTCAAGIKRAVMAKYGTDGTGAKS